VRAVWAGAPFVWQIYPQADGVHAVKLQALLDRLPPVPGLPALWQAWNGLSRGGWPAWPDSAGWRAACTAFRAQQGARPDLATALLGFVESKVASC